MAQTKQRPTKSEADNPDPGNPMLAITPMTAEVWREFMGESLRFVTDRLQKDLETQHAMLRCTSPAELVQVQAKFFENALTQYAEETSRLFRIMSKATGSARGYDDVPL